MTTTVNNTDVNFIYLTIPTDYVNTYRKLIKCLANIKSFVDSCECSQSKLKAIKVIYECWLMFNSAVANHKINQKDKAQEIIDYIDKVLNNVFFNDESEGGDGDCVCEVLDIDENGILKVRSNHDCCVVPNFYIDIETGNLMSEYDYENEIFD